MSERLDVETFLDEQLDPVIKKLAADLDVSQVDAMAICMFSLASRLNYEQNACPLQIEVVADRQEGNLTLTWFDREDEAPLVTDSRDVELN